MVLGQDLMIYTSTSENTLVPICHSKTCTITRDRDMLLITDPSGPDEKYIPTAKRGTIAADGIMEYSDDISGISVLEWLEAGTLIYFAFATSLTGGIAIAGQAFIDHWEQSGEINNVVTFSFTGKINGKLNIKKTAFQKSIYLADSKGNRLSQCPAAYPVRIFWYDGTVIGIAYDQTDVIGLYNNYPANKDLKLTGFTTPCDFKLSAAWYAEFVPNWIVAESLIDAEFALSDAQIRIIGDGDGQGLTPFQNV